MISADDMNKALLERLHELGVSFSMSMPGGTRFLSPEDLPELLRDRDGLIRRVFGFSEAEFNEWNECQGEVPCSATTKSGKPCRNVVSVYVHPISEWVRMKNSNPRCRSHS